jgi:hypothetical protein
VAGGTYARVAGSFSAAASGVADLAADVEFNVPAATTVSWAGLWAGATFVGAIDVDDETFTNAGTYTLLAALTSVTLAEAA